jgi:hypothetical protein
MCFAARDKWRFGLPGTNHRSEKIVTANSNLDATPNWLAFWRGNPDHAHKVDGAVLEAFWLKKKAK